MVFQHACPILWRVGSFPELTVSLQVPATQHCHCKQSCCSLLHHCEGFVSTNSSLRSLSHLQSGAILGNQLLHLILDNCSVLLLFKCLLNCQCQSLAFDQQFPLGVVIVNAEMPFVRMIPSQQYNVEGGKRLLCGCVASAPILPDTSTVAGGETFNLPLCRPLPWSRRTSFGAKTNSFKSSSSLPV
jgi:hypothetical protein